MHAARRAGSLIWLSEGERRLGFDLWGELPGQVVGTYIDAETAEPAETQKGPYLLYCGRIDPNKGCVELFEFFIRYKNENPSSLRLVLTGKDDVAVPDHPDIEFLGFVSDEEKFRLMSGATVYIMPSGKESFSIVTLEAMAQQTPVLGSGVCQVIVDHIEQSGGGRIYMDYKGFAMALNEMLGDGPGLRKMGEAGRHYVVSNFTRDRVSKALNEAIDACVANFTGEAHVAAESVTEVQQPGRSSSQWRLIFHILKPCFFPQAGRKNDCAR